MSKRKEPSTQLSLWNDPEETPTSQPDPQSVQQEMPPAEPGVVCYRLGEIIHHRTSWADGDTRPEQLERLALLDLGDISFYKFNNGRYVVYRAIATAVIGDSVHVAYEYLCTDREFWLHLPHTPVERLIEEWSKPGSQYESSADDEEEDVA